MKSKNILLGIAGLIALIFLWAFLNEKEKSKRKDKVIDQLTKENHELKSAYLNLLEEFLKAQPEIEPSVLRELNRVKAEIDEMDTATHLELESVIRHVSMKEYAKAVRDLAKILEVKLKEKVVDNPNFKKQPKLHFLLEHTHSAKWINDQDYHNSLQLKNVRNEESHALAVTVKPLDAGLLVFAGIKVLYAVVRRHNENEVELKNRGNLLTE